MQSDLILDVMFLVVLPETTASHKVQDSTPKVDLYFPTSQGEQSVPISIIPGAHVQLSMLSGSVTKVERH